MSKQAEKKDKKTTVGYVLTPITFGGSEKVSLNFLRTIDRNRFDLHPILLTRPWEEETYFSQELSRLGYTYEAVPVAVKPSGDFFRVLRVLSQIGKIVRQKKCDVLHTHGYFADICGLPAAKWLGIPCLSTCHGFIANENKLKVYNFLDKRALKLSNKIIAVSEDIRKELVCCGVKESKISVIQNAVSTSLKRDELKIIGMEVRQRLSIHQDDYVIGFLGRLSEEKGVSILIKAASFLNDETVSFKLVVVGDGPERSCLEQQVRAEGLEGRVIFTGFQNNVEAFLALFDVFVLPSLTEGTPLALLESMSAGVPVIASEVGGVPNVVTDGLNGFLVKPGDFHAISERVRLLINDPVLQKRMSSAGIITIKEKYDLVNWCRTIENLYCELDLLNC